MSQITIILKPAEKETLLDLADRERMDPCSLGGLLVREVLEHRGLLRSNKVQNDSLKQETGNDRSSKSAQGNR
jgi:hypothetical protein